MFKDICKLALSKIYFPIKSKMPENIARTMLDAYSPKPKGSCYAVNSFRIDYDLQIIIPAYNAEKYLESCLDSVISQKSEYKTLVTVVNDGSTDSTSTILNNVFLKFGGGATDGNRNHQSI